MLKKLAGPLLTAFFLAGCMSKDTVLIINPKIQLPPGDHSFRRETVTITGVDRRTESSIAKLNFDGHLITYSASRDLRYLLREALEKQMEARGYLIGPRSQINLQIVINKLYANVTQGNLRYTITTNANVAIIATSKNGKKQIKNYRQTYSEEGVFAVTNEKITNAVNTTLSGIITDMALDTSFEDFIKQNAR